MYRPSPSSTHKFELESAILSSSLRLSLVGEDKEGISKAAYELAVLNPDLVPRGEEIASSVDYYERLGLEKHVNPSDVAIAFLKEQKKHLRRGVSPDSREYLELLNAGVTLRNSRLRISHDLVIALCWLKRNNFDIEIFDVEFKMPEKLPSFLELLKRTKTLDESQVKAILFQKKLYPEVSILELVRQAGYLDDDDLNFFLKAEIWVTRKLMTLGQLQVIVWNKKLTGGSWDDFFGPGEPENPSEPAGVPRNPLPSAGSGSAMLELPEPDPENDLDFSP